MSNVNGDSVPALELVRQDYEGRCRLADEMEKSGRENGDTCMIHAAQQRRRRARVAYENAAAAWVLDEQRRLPDRYRLTPMH